MSSQVSLEEWVEQRYARPVILVESSAAADAICARHGLDTVQMLRPHSVYTGGPLSSRTGDRSDPVTCSRFGVRLMRTECVRDVALSQVTRHVRRLMRSSAAMDMAYGEQLDRAVESIVQGSRSRYDGSLPHPIRAPPPPTSSAVVNASGSTGGPSPPSTLLERACPSWHRAFVRDFHSLVRCSSFDTVDHPVGVLFTVATSETGGVDGILQVFRAQARRIAELKASLPGMDNELHQYYLILHDNTAPSSPSLSTARQVLTAVQQLYGANYCALIKVNSVLDPRAMKSLDPSLWVDASPAVMDVPSAQAVHRAATAGLPSSLPASTVAASTGTASPASSVTSSDGAAASPAASTAIARSAVLSFRTVSPTCGTWPGSDAVMLTGCFMSPEDVTEVHNVMAYYLSQSLFKYVERRLRMLDVSVQDRRTTTLGKMAAWFKGKDEVRPRAAEVVYPPHGSDPSVLPKYMATSLEMQMRHCGDLSLVLHDYEGAMVYYRLCIEELLETLSQRPYNRAMIAACQEGIGVAQLLQRRAPPPSLTPWYTGITSSTHRISSQANRWEVAWNDYLAAGAQIYAVRIAFLLCEYCRTRQPPMLDRCRAILLHLQRSGVLQRQYLLSGVVSDMLAGIVVFANAPFAAGLSVPPPIPRDYPMVISLRRFARYLQQAGAFYRADNSLDQALRCYLRVLELFRLIDPQETWEDLAEHLYLTVGQLYTQLGQEVRGIAMASAAVAQGTPLYRRPETSQQAFNAFWAQQKQVLSNMGYALCPHMPMPRILRASFHVDRNDYSTDATTDDVARRMSETTAEAEWRGIEKQLKKTYTEMVLKTHPQYRFPSTHGSNGSCVGGGGSGISAYTGNCTGGGARKEGGSRTCRPGGGGSPGAGTGPFKERDYIFADLAVPGGPSPRSPRHYKIARAEPLVLSFVMENPVGCPLEVTDLTLLYLSFSAPDQLWKSSTTQTVRLAAGARQRVSLTFDPVAEGKYAIIGLCWSLMGQEGYYYFATRESRPGCPESLYEYAIEHPMPTLEAVENIHVTVQPSKACVTASFHPRLPDQLFDGEYFHTKLVVRNTSTQQDATHVFLQRSSTTAHLMYVEEFGLAKNLDVEAPLVLADHLKAQETRSFTVTIRGQHRRGDVSLQSSGNYIFILLAYLPGTPSGRDQQQQQQTTTTPGLSGSNAHLLTSAGTSTTEFIPATGVTSLTVGAASASQPLPNPLFNGKLPPPSNNSSSSPPVMVRLHRLLRRCDVQPVLTMYSTVLPPANASLKAAVVLTVKNVGASQSRPCATSAGAGLTLPPTTPSDVVRAIPVAAASVFATQTAAQDTPTVASPSSYTPLRVARVLAVHSSRWSIECSSTEELVADCASQCLLTQGDCLSIALLVKRLPRVAGAADTTARQLFLSRAATGEGEAVSPYTDTTCLPIDKALPSLSRIKNVETHLGTTVAQSSRSLFFLQTSCLGPGRIGAQTASDDSNGGLAFYADKAGQQKEPPKSPAQRRRDEVAEECRLCGGATEQYTPLALAVTWVREGSDGLRKGQLFLFVDPIEHVYQTVAQQQKRQADQEAAAQHRLISAVSTLNASGSITSVEQTQQELCDAMLVRYASLKPWQGAVVSHVRVPPVVRAYRSGSGGSPTAEIPVTLRCISLAPVPLLVTAEALPPSTAAATTATTTSSPPAMPQSFMSTMPPTPRSPSPLAVAMQRSSGSSGEVPVLFVGKTVHTFLLMPSEEFEVKFTAHALRPGIVDCQRITLRAASICFVHGSVEVNGKVVEGRAEDGDVDNRSMTSLVQPLMRTGMTLPALVRALLERRSPTFSASMTARAVASAQQLFLNGQGDGYGTSVTATNSGGDVAGNGTSSLDHWQALTRSPCGPAEAAHARSSVAMLVERYGPRAAELLHQLSPRGPAASSTVSQIIPQTTPALTRVVMDDAGPYAASASISTSVVSAVGTAHAHEMTCKFFRQLDAFEAEVQRAAAQASSTGTAADPFLLQYIYRPTVKSVDISNGSVLSCSNSLVMARSSVPPPLSTSPAASASSSRTPASAGRLVSPQLTCSPATRSTPEKDTLVTAAPPASSAEDAASPLPLSPPSTSSPLMAQMLSSSSSARPTLVMETVERQAASDSSVFGSPAAVAQAAVASPQKPENGASAAHAFSQLSSWESNVKNNGNKITVDSVPAHREGGKIRNAAGEREENNDKDEDGGSGEPASPLHLPAVAFERRAAEAAETLDIGENSSGGDGGGVILPPHPADELVLGKGTHVHGNSYYRNTGGDNDSFDSVMATNTLTEYVNCGETSLAAPSYCHDFTDVDSADEVAMDVAHNPVAKTKPTTTTLLVPSSVQLERQHPLPSPAPKFDSTSSSTDSSTSPPSDSSGVSARRSPCSGAEHPLA